MQGEWRCSVSLVGQTTVTGNGGARLSLTNLSSLVFDGVDPVPWTVLSLWSLAPVLRIFIPPGLHAAQSAAHAAEALP